MACLDNAELLDRLEGAEIEVAANEGDLAAGISMARTGRSSWRFFMLAALCLLVGESLFADRILGRKNKQKTAATPSPPLAEVA